MERNDPEAYNAAPPPAHAVEGVLVTNREVRESIHKCGIEQPVVAYVQSSSQHVHHLALVHRVCEESNVISSSGLCAVSEALPLAPHCGHMPAVTPVSSLVGGSRDKEYGIVIFVLRCINSPLL